MLRHVNHLAFVSHDSTCTSTNTYDNKRRPTRIAKDTDPAGTLHVRRPGNNGHANCFPCVPPAVSIASPKQLSHRVIYGTPEDFFSSLFSLLFFSPPSRTRKILLADARARNNSPLLRPLCAGFRRVFSMQTI